MIRILLVGAGRIASKHIDAITKLSTIAKIAGIVEIDKAKHHKLNEDCKCDLFTDIDEGISVTKPHVAVILTDSGSHFNIAKRLCGKVPHVLVEKPMTLNLRAAHTLIDIYKKSTTTLSVVKQNRYNAAIQFMAETLRNPKFGKPNISSVKLRWCRSQEYYDQASWRGKWATDGGVIANQAIHHLDLQQWLMGDFESVFAVSSTYGSEIEVEDSLVATVKFKSGAIGTIEATTAARPSNIEASISVLGSQGTIQVGGFAANKIDYCTLASSVPKTQQEEISSSDVYGTGHAKMYREYLQKIYNDEEYGLSGEEALKSIKLINALYKSIEEGREVKFSENCSSKILGKSSASWQ